MRDDKYRQKKKRQYPYQQNRRDFVEKPSKAKFSDVQDMEENSAVVEGRNAVFELMRSQRSIEKIYVIKDTNKDVVEKARAQRISVAEMDRRKFESMRFGQNTQGVVALCSPIDYCELQDIIDYAKEKGEKPFIILIDGLNSPHNLGAIIRTAECAGAHGVVIPLHRCVGITPTVTRVSEGAVNHVRICKVVNIKSAIEELQKNGVWVACADMDGDIYTQADLTGPIAVVVGGEDKGITPMIKKTCDFCLKIPQKGILNSLNASVAAAVLMYEVVRQRG